MAEEQKTAEELFEEWSKKPIPKNWKEQLGELSKDPEEIIDAFSKEIAFGTGGMRAKMGIGINRINGLTITRATKGLGNFIQQQYTTDGPLRVAIAYDGRHQSKTFAHLAARVLATLSIDVHITEDVRPTPFLSFCVRHYKAHAGIMITASHNSKEYNGYKVYGRDGAQVSPPDDAKIIHAVNAIDLLENTDLPEKSDRIHIIKSDVDDMYLNQLCRQQCLKSETEHALSIVYTNLHGTGITLLPEALKRFGFSNISFVDKQKAIDPNFTFAPSPNPEDPKALQLGTDQMLSQKSDLLIATDPDSDRMGCVVNHQGHPVRLSGNQIAVLILDFLIQSRSVTSSDVVVSTIVSSRMLSKIARQNQLGYMDVLTGFKYIGAKIREFELAEKPRSFFFGAEESYGYLIGTHSRDKDAQVAACVLAEAAETYLKKKTTLIDRLQQLYKDYGVFAEKQGLLKLKSNSQLQAASDQILSHLKTGYENLSKALPSRVKTIEDFSTHEQLDVANHKTMPQSNTLPPTSMVKLSLEDDSHILVRPSGTEPKVKIYVQTFTPCVQEVDQHQEELNQKCDDIIREVKTFLEEATAT